MLCWSPCIKYIFLELFFATTTTAVIFLSTKKRQQAGKARYRDIGTVGIECEAKSLPLSSLFLFYETLNTGHMLLLQKFIQKQTLIFCSCVAVTSSSSPETVSFSSFWKEVRKQEKFTKNITLCFHLPAKYIPLISILDKVKTVVVCTVCTKRHFGVWHVESLILLK